MTGTKKAINIIILAIFAIFLIAPLLSAGECQMECCEKPIETTCGLEMSSDTCCPVLTECSEVLLIPIISAPILKVNIEKNIILDYLAITEINPISNNSFSTQTYQLKLLTTEIHAGFQTPLLV